MPRLIPLIPGLLLGLVVAAPALAAPALPTAIPGCVERPRTPAAARTPDDIDYTAINWLLMHPDARERLDGLPDEIARLERARAPEAALVRQRLLLSLAQAQAASARPDRAIATLKQLPLDSPRAPEALQLMAELELELGRPEAALRWLQQLAELFPDDAHAVRGLWRAAELSPDPVTAMGFLQRAAALSGQDREVAQQWLERSRQPDFLERVEALPPGLWRLAQAALTDPAFAEADAAQAEARRQLQCLSALEQARGRLQQQSPRLLADLAATVESLEAPLQSGRAELAARERRFLDTAGQWKECRRQRQDCAALQVEHDRQGRALTGWRNRLQDMEKKLAYLRANEERLALRWRQEQAAGVVAAQRLADRRGAEHAVMKALLQTTLATALEDRETLAAEAHFRLATAQEAAVRSALGAPSPAP